MRTRSPSGRCGISRRRSDRSHAAVSVPRRALFRRGRVRPRACAWCPRSRGGAAGRSVEHVRASDPQIATGERRRRKIDIGHKRTVGRELPPRLPAQFGNVDRSRRRASGPDYEIRLGIWHLHFTPAGRLPSLPSQPRQETARSAPAGGIFPFTPLPKRTTPVAASKAKTSSSGRRRKRSPRASRFPPLAGALHGDFRRRHAFAEARAPRVELYLLIGQSGAAIGGSPGAGTSCTSCWRTGTTLIRPRQPRRHRQLRAAQVRRRYSARRRRGRRGSGCCRHIRESSSRTPLRVNRWSDRADRQAKRAALVCSSARSRARKRPCRGSTAQTHLGLLFTFGIRSTGRAGASDRAPR